MGNCYETKNHMKKQVKKRKKLGERYQTQIVFLSIGCKMNKL